MDDKLKYRLVGASVILALAVFFLPMILDSEKYRSQIQSQIPAVPLKVESPESGEDDNAQIANQTSAVEQGPLVINLDNDDDPAHSDTITEKELNQSAKNSQEDASTPVQEKLEVEQQVTSTSKKESNKDIKPVASSDSATAKESDKESAGATNSSNVTNQSKQEPTQSVVQEESAKESEPSGNKDTLSKDLAFSESAWLIQIGSFSNKENATRLVNDLRKEGYRAYQRVGDSYARVYVGPYPVKAEAESRTAKLESIVGAKVKIIEFDPKQH